MADYDVQAKIEVDSAQGLAGVHSIAQALLALQKDIASVGTGVTQALRGVKPAAADFSGAVKVSAAAMQQLEKTASRESAAVTREIKTTTSAMRELEATTKQTAASTRRTGAMAREAAGGLGGMVRSALAIGGAYLGVRVLSGAIMGLARSSFTYGAQLEKNRIALASVLATQAQFASAPNPMAAAMRVGDAVFRDLQKDALESVASSKELIGIYSSIAGPLAGAGTSLASIRTITNDTVSAAAALGVDFAQASRDINQMATGVAGQDTMLFRMLRSTGAIKENTEQWNKMMQETPTKGVEALSAALGKFRAAAAIYAQSLPGLTSSFGDFLERFRSAFMRGPLASMQGLLARLVATFTANEARITSVLTVMGNAFARFMQPAVAAIERATNYMINHWEDIAARMERASAMLGKVKAGAQHFAPTLQVAAGAMVAARVAPGAAWAFIVEVFTGLTILGGLATALAVAGTAALAVVSVIGFMADVWKSLAMVFAIVWSLVQEIAVTVGGLLAAAFSVVFPLAKILVAIVATLALLIGTILFGLGRIIWTYFLKPVLDGWTLIFEYLGKAVGWLYDQFVGMFNELAAIFGSQGIVGKGGAAGGGGWLADLIEGVKNAGYTSAAEGIADDYMWQTLESGAPATRATTVNDFRGSKIEVKQDFRQADPDRVWLQMVEGINGAAERRLSSALVPDFTR